MENVSLKLEIYLFLIKLEKRACARCISSKQSEIKIEKITFLT